MIIYYLEEFERMIFPISSPEYNFSPTLSHSRQVISGSFDEADELPADAEPVAPAPAPPALEETTTVAVVLADLCAVVFVTSFCLYSRSGSNDAVNMKIVDLEETATKCVLLALVLLLSLMWEIAPFTSGFVMISMALKVL